jgi:hypothetical protein
LWQSKSNRDKTRPSVIVLYRLRAAELFQNAVVRNRAAKDAWGISYFACILRPHPDN